MRLALYLVGSLLSFMTIAPLFWMVSMSLKETNEVFGTSISSRITRHSTISSMCSPRSISSAISGTRSSFRPSSRSSRCIFHSMAGYALARLRFPGRDAIFLAMFATFLISQPVIIVPLFILARTLHLLDSYAGLIVPVDLQRVRHFPAAPVLSREFRENSRRRR